MQAEIKKIFDKIRIILVGTTHPGNIGAAARAMKTMGLSQLGLIRPRSFPGAEATARAAGADGILDDASVYGSIREALADCSLVYGTSNRDRNLAWQVSDADTAADSVIRAAAGGSRVAILFGSERSGLSNRDLESCNAVIRIPVNADFPSLNLASAVQVVSYELYKSAMRERSLETPETALIKTVSNAQMALLYDHLKECLQDINFYDPERPRLLMRRLIRLFNRLYLDENEYNIIRGILAAAQQAANKGTGKSE